MRTREANYDMSSNNFISLPPELLTHIFSYCSSNSIISPSNFTQTCSYWRSIALSSPKLWTDLVIELPPRVPSFKTKADVSRLDTLITEWIMRSSNLAINLSVTHPNFRHQTQRDLYVELYKNIMIRFSYKWRTLLLPFVWDAHELLGSLEELPMLEEIAVDSMVHSSAQFSFPNAPRLHKLAITFRSSIISLASLKETIVDLTLLSMHGLSARQIRELLLADQLQKLTHLEINKVDCVDPFILLPSTIIPNLQKFSIWGPTAALEKLLNALTLPSLHELSLETSSTVGVLPLPVMGPALVDLQKRSHLPLSVLRLTGMLEETRQAISFDDFFLFLQSTDTIKELHIITYGGTDTYQLMDLLSYDEEKRILPHLKVLSAHSLFDSTDPDSSYFVDFLGSRCWGDYESERRPSAACRLEEFKLYDGRLSNKTQVYLGMSL